jgi:uncharacterized membrane protein
MMSTIHAGPGESEELDKSAPGRGRAIIVYGLYLGAIMLPLTLPLGALLAWLGYAGSAGWVRSHLRYQLWTFWLLLALLLVVAAIWWLQGLIATAPMAAWVFGYIAATLLLAWFVGRCAVGIHRLTGNRPVDRPRSLLFGA